MSLTGVHHVFASIDEAGINRALQAFFAARPHYLHYGSPPFVSASTTSVTEIAPISFPGTAGGIAFAVDLGVPAIDLFPPDGVLPPPLVLGAGQLSVTLAVELTIGCTNRQGDQRRNLVTPVTTALEVIAIAHPVSRYFSPGVGDISFHVDEVVLPEVAPASLQSLLDCILEMILNAVLAGVLLPFNLIDAGFVKLALEEGPTIEDNQIEIWGDVS